MLQTQSLTLGGTQLQLQRSQRRAGRSSCGTQAAQRQFRCGGARHAFLGPAAAPPVVRRRHASANS